LLRIPIDLDAFPVGQEAAVFGEENASLGPIVGRGGKNLTRRGNRKPDLGQGPIFAEARVTGLGRFGRILVPEKGRDFGDKVALIIGQCVLHILGRGVGDTLVQEGLLAFQQELLVTQRAEGQPGQHQAGHEHRQHED